MSLMAEATITAENQWTVGINLQGIFNISVGGSGWVATVTFQRSFDNQVTWNDISTFTTSTEDFGTVASESDVYCRLGSKTGEFTSGSIPVRLSQ